MEKKLNQLRSTSENTSQHVDNFTELNFKSIDIGNLKNAWMFFKVQLDAESEGRKYDLDYLYIRTESGNLYKVFKKDWLYLCEVTTVEKAKEIMNTFSTDRCIYNPQTKKIIAVENMTITCGESFAYAPTCTTSPIKEIIGVSRSTNEVQPSLKSNIENEFEQRIR